MTLDGASRLVFALICGGITIFTDLNLVVVIIGALLAWMTSVPGTLGNRVSGMAIYGVVGAVGILIANAIDDQLLFAVAMSALAVVCTLPMAVSSRGYLVGWSVIITFIQAVNMTGSEEPWESALKLVCVAQPSSSSSRRCGRKARGRGEAPVTTLRPRAAPTTTGPSSVWSASHSASR